MCPSLPEKDIHTYVIRMKVMITGHRPDKLGGYDENNPVAKRIKTELSMQLELLLFEDPKIEIITGLAQGADTWFAEIGIEKNIPIHAYIPFTGQESMWPKKAQERYREILAKCKVAKLISQEVSKKAFLQRNDAMVHDADMAIAVWDGSSNSGTGYTTRKLKLVRKKVIVINT